MIAGYCCGKVLAGRAPHFVLMQDHQVVIANPLSSSSHVAQRGVDLIQVKSLWVELAADPFQVILVLGV